MVATVYTDESTWLPQQRGPNPKCFSVNGAMILLYNNITFGEISFGLKIGAIDGYTSIANGIPAFIKNLFYLASILYPAVTTTGKP